MAGLSSGSTPSAPGPKVSSISSISRTGGTDKGQHVKGVAQQAARFTGFASGQELQKQRHIVRQFVRHRFEIVTAILLDQVHHGLTARAVFAVDVLEQVQRLGRVAVEGLHITFLQADEVAAFQRQQQRLQHGGRRGAVRQQVPHIVDGVDQLRLRVAQQHGQGFVE